MSGVGYIKAYRELAFHEELWLSEKFTRGQAWVDLLMLANFKRGYIRIRGNKITIERGQVGWSELRLSKRWQWSRTKVRAFLGELQNDERISIKRNTKTTIITILNYDIYQGLDPAKKTTESATERQQKNTNKEGKEEYSIPPNAGDPSPAPPPKPKKRTSKTIPPTLKEVTAYCQKRQNGVDPQEFLDHYEANGWMRGKSKVKDWMACVRTWEATAKRRSNRQGSLPTGQKTHGDGRTPKFDYDPTMDRGDIPF